MTNPGVLYIVATPIGNLEDITERALKTLRAVDLIAAEDTRHSQKLLTHFGIETRMWPYHDHSDDKHTENLLDTLKAGRSIALISDAGTPLISDPGYRLVSRARDAGIRVVPVPGVSALITALSAAGIATDRFSFEGFLPAKSASRLKRLKELDKETRTLVFYESPHRIRDCLADAMAVLGGSRRAVMARELTKTYETFLGATLAEIHTQVCEDDNQRRGEIVLMVEGQAQVKEADDAIEIELDTLLNILSRDLPTKHAAAIAAELSGHPKKVLYQKILAKKSSD